MGRFELSLEPGGSGRVKKKGPHGQLRELLEMSRRGFSYSRGDLSRDVYAYNQYQLHCVKNWTKRKADLPKSSCVYKTTQAW